MTSCTRIFVGGVPSNATTDALRESFSEFGVVVSCELKSKQSDPDGLQFAFLTLSTDQTTVEACLHHFSQTKWKGTHLHVTRARESFLERLQKERQQAQIKKPVETPAYRSNGDDEGFKIKKSQVPNSNIKKLRENITNGFHKEHKNINNTRDFDNIVKNEKQLNSDSKRLESMRKMRQQFNEKKLLIKSGLAGVDKASNKRIRFEDEESLLPEKDVTTVEKNGPTQNGHARTLFNDDSEEEDVVDFQIKKQFEGKKGQKVLELQSRFKSDKRFAMDERFIEDEDEKDKPEQKTEGTEQEDEIQVPEEDEKTRQLNILQDVLGVAIKGTHSQPERIVDTRKTKARLGMLRFDPNQPHHAKFLAPETKKEEATKKKKKKKEESLPEPELAMQKVEVSKEQFYKISDSLKETIAQSNSFSMRSLFGKQQAEDDADEIQDTGYTPLPAARKDKVKNPLDTTGRNPFKYDSSDSEPDAEETEDGNTVEATSAEAAEDGKTKAVWRENLFFAKFDDRFKEGLTFFNTQASGNKERRELKSLVKKRLYNRARKDQMFQKKIGGRRKTFGKKKR